MVSFASAAARSPVLLTLRLIAASGRTVAFAFAIVALVSAVVPGAMTIALGEFVGRVTPAAGTGPRSEAASQLVLAGVVLAVLFLLYHLRTALADVLSEMVGLRVEHRLQQQAMAAALAPRGIEQLERPDVRDSLALAKSIESSLYPPAEAVRSVGMMLAWNLGAVGQVVILATFEWWLPVVLIVAHLPYIAWGHPSTGHVQDVPRSRQRAASAVGVRARPPP